MFRKVFFTSAIAVPIAIGLAALYRPAALWALVPTVALIGLGIHDVLQRRHSLLRIYPIIGHGRYLFEDFRPEIQQYFVESNIDGRPYSREFRSLVYQRAKAQRQTLPFGTQRDVYRVGYEWTNHSLAPSPALEEEPRVRIGGLACTLPYLASRLNISAMSFGALGKNAVLALNKGAEMGGFAHNTGEGGLSPFHLEPGGDLIWQIGTGYFGCRLANGCFDSRQFAESARRSAVRMIEIKLSQGAKPGHGGILPAAKLTREIATIRGVPMGEDVISPPSHSAFSNPSGLLEFVALLRELSGGKPVGFKLCVGHSMELLGICKAMLDTKILPDFITVDGAEGGTGAAPVEFSNSVGMPMREGLLYVHNALNGIGLRQKIRLIAAGQISTGFHLLRAIALGADMCNAARAMMFALGCIQARRCDSNTCPVGVATQDPSRVKGLDVTEKAGRVASYHRQTIKGFLDIVSAAGLDDPSQIRPQHVYRRVDSFQIKHFGQIYSFLPEGCLLSRGSIPQEWRSDWEEARADRF